MNSKYLICCKLRYLFTSTIFQIKIREQTFEFNADYFSSIETYCLRQFSLSPLTSSTEGSRWFSGQVKGLIFS